MAIKYIYDGDPPLEGVPCAACGHKSFFVLRCCNCGKAFCRSCKPSAFEDWENDDTLVTCDCGSFTLFVDYE